MRTIGTIIIGVGVSSAIWLVAGMLMLGHAIGDCFPTKGHACPSDAERNLAILAIFLGAFILNIAAVWLLSRLSNRRRS